MEKIIGIGVCEGIAIGTVNFVQETTHDVAKHRIDDSDEEIERLRAAIRQAVEQLHSIRDKTAREVGESQAEIFDAHQMMLQDPSLIQDLSDMITSDEVNAEYAMDTVAKRYAHMFKSMDSPYMQARSVDVEDIARRVISLLENPQTSGKQGESRIGSQFIYAASDITPSETADMNKEQVLGFVTKEGAANSHTAILARTLGIPAVVGLGDALQKSMVQHTLIVDGGSGTVIIDPDRETERHYRRRQSEQKEQQERLSLMKGLASVTSSGQEVRLFANIAKPSDIGSAVNNDAEGIGLFRSEFLYLDSPVPPSEEQQFDAYRQVAEGMNGKPVIIRTLDIGADKQVDYLDLGKEANPALGYRAIRICLTQPDIFKTQLRALYRASVYGSISIMLPMIISLDEIRQSKQIIAEVQQDLQNEGVPFKEDVPLGIMIETPASVIMAEELAQEVDFFSIGTNDLTQYTLACDRQNPKLAKFADPHHPAIIKMIEMTAKAAHANDIWCGICGELGADLSLLHTFLDIGVDELSVSPAQILRLRAGIRNI